MKLKLLKPYGSGYVAFSGGGDSTALVHSLLDRNREVKLLFFNHGIKEDDEAEEWVNEFSIRNKLILHIGRISSGVPVGRSVEDYWREERYLWLNNFDDKPIYIGHHFDDVLETYCQSFFTGNPKFIPFKRGNNISRPLLLNDKSKILDYLHSKGIDYIDCPTNKDVKYSRNRVRHVLLPYLESYNPSLRNTVKRKLIKQLSTLGVS
jgi:tRNA(Ile)-lysidine synthase